MKETTPTTLSCHRTGTGGTVQTIITRQVQIIFTGEVQAVQCILIITGQVEAVKYR